MRSPQPAYTLSRLPRLARSTWATSWLSGAGSGLGVVAEDTGTRTKVVLEWATGERVVCSTGKDAASRSVVHALQDSAGALI